MAKPKCAGTNRAGGPCQLYPMTGATVCRSHGGAAPQVKAAAARRVVEGQALKAVSAMGNWAPVTDPLSALADVAGEVTAVKDFLRGLVDEIVERERRANGNPIMDAIGKLTDAESLRMPDDKGAEQMNAKFQAYMAMLNSTVATLATIAKLNIDERMARIEEARKTMIIEAMRRGFAAAGVTGEAHTRGLAATVRHLRVVGS
jgi:hypothetical protein